MIALIAAYLAKTGMDKVDAFKWARRIFTALIAIAAVLLLLFVIRFSSCGTPDNQKIKEEIIKDKIEANVLSNTKKEIENNVNKSANSSNNALDNFNKVLKKDSNAFKGNAEDKYCTKFCPDSTCRNWRLAHPEFICKENN